MDAGCQQENAACLRMIAESHGFLVGQIHNVRNPKGQHLPSYTGKNTHVLFFPPKRSHTQRAGPVEAVAVVVWGAEWGPSWAQGLCSSFIGSASLWWWAHCPLLPVDLHHSGPLIKPPFTKTKAGEEGGKEREKGSDGSVERQRRWGGQTLTRSR